MRGLFLNAGRHIYGSNGAQFCSSAQLGLHRDLNLADIYSKLNAAVHSLAVCSDFVGYESGFPYQPPYWSVRKSPLQQQDS